jgi:hypothetical protein
MIVFYPSHDYFSSDKINNADFFGGFGTKRTSERKIFKSFYPVGAYQTHSTNIHVVTAYQSVINNADGLITKTKKILLVIKTADCVPMIFTDQKNKIIGISHQGWRGTLKKMAIKMVEAMIDNGAMIQELIVFIGPAICKLHYAVDRQLYNQFAQVFNLKAQDNHLDLKEINRQQLLTLGLKENQIEVSSYCPFCQHDLFYSYRREGKKLQGRMLNFIALKD